MWAAWSPSGCYRMCLTDNNFKNLATGDVVDKLLHEWGFMKMDGKTDPSGFFEATLLYGDYEVKISHPHINYTTSSHQLQVMPTDEPKQLAKFVKFFV